MLTTRSSRSLLSPDKSSKNLKIFPSESQSPTQLEDLAKLNTSSILTIKLLRPHIKSLITNRRALSLHKNLLEQSMASTLARGIIINLSLLK